MARTVDCCQCVVYAVASSAGLSGGPSTRWWEVGLTSVNGLPSLGPGGLDTGPDTKRVHKVLDCLLDSTIV